MVIFVHPLGRFAKSRCPTLRQMAKFETPPTPNLNQLLVMSSEWFLITLWTLSFPYISSRCKSSADDWVCGIKSWCSACNNWMRFFCLLFLYQFFYVFLNNVHQNWFNPFTNLYKCEIQFSLNWKLNFW